MNVYQLNLYQTLIFMYKYNNKMTPKIFNEYFKKVEHKYFTRYAENKFYKPKTITKASNYRISYRGVQLWDNYLDKNVKNISSYPLFKSKIKQTILNKENELEFY